VSSPESMPFMPFCLLPLDFSGPVCAPAAPMPGVARPGPGVVAKGDEAGSDGVARRGAGAGMVPPELQCSDGGSETGLVHPDWAWL
jgi:hypothetical protein